jgi:hypothetical protein
MGIFSIAFVEEFSCGVRGVFEPLEQPIVVRNKTVRRIYKCFMMCLLNVMIC